MTKPFVAHVLPVSDNQSPGWLIYAPARQSAHAKMIPKMLEDWTRKWLKREKGWFISLDAYPKAISALEHELDPREVFLCDECLAGTPCVIWPKGVLSPALKARDADAKPGTNDSGAFDMHGFVQGLFVPQEILDACSVLNVTWPTSRKAVADAYKRASFNAHPDRGGSETVMRKVNAARDTLNKAMGGL